MFLFSTATLVVFIYTRKLISSSPADMDLAFNQYRVALKVLWWLTVFGESCYNTGHWIFAMKYWTLAYKIKLIKERKDPDKQNHRFFIIFVIGIILNILTAVFN